MNIQKCPICGAPSYDGLCWKCRIEKTRNETLAWTDEQKEEKLRTLIRDVSVTGHLSKQNYDDFWNLLYVEVCRHCHTAAILLPCYISRHEHTLLIK